MLSIKLQNLLALCLAIASTTSLIGQSDLRNDALFFEETLADYQAWMDKTGMSTILTIDTLIINPDFLDLELAVPTAHHWFALRNQFQDSTKEHIGDALLYKFLFQMEIGRDSATIGITADDSGYRIDIHFQEEEVAVKELLPDATAKNNGIQVKLSMDAAMENTMRTRRSKEEVKRLITNYFKQHYEEKTVWGSKSKYEAIQYGDILSLEISNIKKEILHDFLIGYFELISIDIHLEQKGELLEITYHLQGKYGSGVFVAPRRSGYKDMDGHYEAYLARYKKWIHFQLEQILTGQMIKN